MKRARSLCVVLGVGFVVAAGACGGGGGDTGEEVDELDDIGFATPTEATQAYKEVDGIWELQGPANWSCLNTPTADLITSLDVMLDGKIQDFQTDKALPDASLTVYNDTDFSSQGMATTTSDADGDFQIMLPKGGKRWAFKVEVEDALDTYTLNEYYDPGSPEQAEELSSVSLLTAQALPAFINVTRTPGLGIVAGTIRDCDGNEVSGAVAATSDVADVPSFIEGGASYYFSALSTSLPVRHSQQKFTNTDGIFVSIELPASPNAFVQIWGFVDDADLADGEMTMLAQIPAPILADSVVIARMEPLRN